MAYGSKNNRKKILSSIVEGADGGSIMGALEASMKEEDNRSRGRGAVSAAKSLEDTYEKVSSMKRSLGEQTTKTNEAINKSRSSDSSIAKDWMTVLSGQAEADKPANDIKRSEMLARRMADPQTVDDIYLDTGKLGPRGTVLDVPYVPSDNPDDAPITYSGDQAAGASGRTAAIDAALKKAQGEEEEDGPLSPDDMPITRANTEGEGLMTRPKARPEGLDKDEPSDSSLVLDIPDDVSKDTDFMASIKSTASSLNVSEDDLLRVIQFETAGSWDPAQPAYGSNGVGLIQFMPETAKGLGTTTKALAKMTRAQQMPFVEKHLKMFLTDPKKKYNFGDLYLAVHFPAAVGKPDDYIVYSKKHKYKTRRDAYKVNSGMDVNGDGKVTRAEAIARAIGKA